MAIKQNMGKAVAEGDFPIATVNENALVNAPSGEIDIKSRILTVRGVQVMTDRDLAELYGVDVKRLNEQVKRNAERFPSDFMFQLSKVDGRVEDLRMYIGLARAQFMNGDVKAARISLRKMKSQADALSGYEKQEYEAILKTVK